jgi:hypothetical protein
VAAPVISGVVVAEATAQNGILESNEQGVVTWAVTGPNPVRTKSLSVDGAPAIATYGPYGPYAGGAYFYSGVFGPLAAGSHAFVIQVTDSVGGAASYDGNFTVSAPVLTQALAASWAFPTLPTNVAGTLRVSANRWVEQIESTMAGMWSVPAPRLSIGTPGEAADGTLVAAVSIGHYSADDGWAADLRAAGELEFPEVVRLRALSAANGLAAAERVELLGAVVRELRFVGGFSD